MPHVQTLAVVVFASLIALSASAQQVFERNVSKDEKPKPPPARLAIPAPRPALSVNVGVDGGIRSITIEPTDKPLPIDDFGLGDPEEPPPPLAVQRIDLKTAIIERENFDRWVFGDGTTEKDRTRHLEELLLEKITQAAREGSLTAEQLLKLNLAGKGDIKHLYDQIGECRLEFEVARKEFRPGYSYLQGLKPLWTGYQAGPFNEGSLFAKTLRKIEKDRERKKRLEIILEPFPA